MNNLNNQEKETLNAEQARENFQKNLIAFCNQYGETQETLAEKIGCNHGTISNYFIGKTIPKIDILVDIANALHTTPDELLGYPPKKEKNYLQYFSDKTGLKANTIKKLYDYKRWNDHQKDIEALNYIIRYNEDGEEALSLLRCLYEAIYHQPMDIDFLDPDALEAYYNNTEYFLQPHVFNREYVPIGDIYLLLFNKKMADIVKKKATKLDDVKDSFKKFINDTIKENKRTRKKNP